jgi:Raf kinase inhibitor-like YbhB/YbcL family protein
MGDPCCFFRLMKLTSPAFADKQPLPAQYTCKGQNCSPPFEFIDIPAGTASFVLLIEDLDDAAQRVHWLLFNIPGTTTHISEGKVPEGSLEGICQDATRGYQGPCPKFFGGIHRFSFVLYALDNILDVPADADRAVILQAMDGHIIRQSQLLGISEGDQVASALSPAV